MDKSELNASMELFSDGYFHVYDNEGNLCATRAISSYLEDFAKTVREAQRVALIEAADAMWEVSPGTIQGPDTAQSWLRAYVADVFGSDTK